MSFYTVFRLTFADVSPSGKVGIFHAALFADVLDALHLVVVKVGVTNLVAVGSDANLQKISLSHKRKEGETALKALKKFLMTASFHGRIRGGKIQEF